MEGKKRKRNTCNGQEWKWKRKGKWGRKMRQEGKKRGMNAYE